ncbi:hypothetical protein [Bradyrhizobium cosmicum]|uniref:hypothetical protein n=1 Tax=Bradyrhizobium cosmicum TaxID=1404864 RepID=UPI0028F03727|nr:hypothetical protein [Bradyrhizobium cosmicum]
MENGHWDILNEPVQREFIRQPDIVNYQNYYVRQRSGPDFETMRAEVAEAVGVAPENRAHAWRDRGAAAPDRRLQQAEARRCCARRRLDYDSMQYAMNALKARRWVEVT